MSRAVGRFGGHGRRAPICKGYDRARLDVRLVPVCRAPDDSHVLAIARAAKTDSIITDDQDLPVLGDLEGHSHPHRLRGVRHPRTAGLSRPGTPLFPQRF